MNENYTKLRILIDVYGISFEKASEIMELDNSEQILGYMQDAFFNGCKKERNKSNQFNDSYQ